jgi:prephenate dehydratase/chorismate mutase/prephenate dehydratase
MNLAELRGEIDRVDSEILKLLSRRMELALRTGKFKADPADPPRERAVIEGIRNQSRGLVRPEFTEGIFQSVVGEARKLQEEGLSLVGFQGEHGAHSEVAIRSLDPSWIPIPCAEFAEVFEGVQRGELDLGVVPVENSLEGAVTAVNDLLVEGELKIRGEVRVPIHHALLALPDTDIRELRAAYSHPQALAQCRGFLSRNKLEPRPFYDTAGAAMMLARERLKGAAAIASGLCAELYGLEVVKEAIEDHESNSTRFIVISREPSGDEGDKCSLVFSTQHRAGALYDALRIFSEAGINLTRIESRPIRNNPGRYAFLLDFTGSDRDPRVGEVLAKVEKQTEGFKFLGSYKEAGS